MIKCKLGDLFYIKQGFAFKSEKYVSKSSYVLCTLGNFSETNSFKFSSEKATYYPDEFSHDFILHEGDLIIPLTEQVVGLFGNTAFVPHTSDFEFVLNQRVGKIIPYADKADKMFLHYLLSTQLVRDQIEATASGTKQRNTSPDKIYDVTVWIPDISTQNTIGKFLYSLEQKCNVNASLCSELESMAKILYDYWFVQFDFPDENGRPYRTSGGEMVWNDQLLREIPKGWSVSPLLDLCSWNGGSQPPKSQHIYTEQPGYVRFIQNRDYAADNHLTFIPVSDNNKLCDEIDIMVDKYGEAGKTRYGIAGAYNVALSRIDVRFPNTQEYIRSFLSSDAIRNYLSNSCMASTRASLNEDNLSMLKVVVPTSTMLQRYEQFGKLIIHKILSLRKENEEMTKLRDWLLPMLMNGQATVE